MSNEKTPPIGSPQDLRDRSDDAGDDVTVYRDRPSDDGKKGQKANRQDAPGAMSSLGNFSEEDLYDAPDNSRR